MVIDKLLGIEKEISLEELGEIYYKMKKNYRGYEFYRMSKKYFANGRKLTHVNSFEKFINIFKFHKYRII